MLSKDLGLVWMVYNSENLSPPMTMDTWCESKPAWPFRFFMHDSLMTEPQRRNVFAFVEYTGTHYNMTKHNGDLCVYFEWSDVPVLLQDLFLPAKAS
jgi:hypothetical protein